MNQDLITTTRRNGIYLLPNLFTTAALFAGFYAIVSAMHGRFTAAAIAIFIAMVMDGLDGRVARITKTQSDFGAQYDSLSDMVSFGLAPALIVYEWGMTGLGKLGWLAAFIYATTTALRLARFNTQVGVADKRYFQGLASPAAAAIMAGMVWVASDYGFTGDELKYMAIIITIVVSALMISNVRYSSFKEIDFKGKVPFLWAVMIMLIFSIVYLHPPGILFGLAIIYGCSGPILTIVQLKQRRELRRKSHEQASEN